MALGATFIDLSSKDKKELNINSGVKIQTLGAGKLKSIGLREGDVIVKVNNEVIETVEQLTTKLNNQGNRGILLEIITQSGMREFKGFGL
jgi:S1-C subfamily serine protease